MIKPLWEVRDLHKLLNGLTIAVITVIVCYTILSLIAIPDLPKKLFLLRVPAVSVVCVATLLFLGRRMKKSKNKTTKQIKLYSDLYVGLNVISVVAFAIIQADYLNIVKGVSTFSPIVVPTIVIGLIVFFIYKLIEIRKAK